MRAVKILAVVALILGLCFLGFKALNKQSSREASPPQSGKFISDFDDLRGQKFKLADQEVLNVDELIKLIPQDISLTYDNVSFDANTGSTRLNNVKITMADNANIGVNLGLVSLWGVDQKAITDRLTGQRLQETMPIAKRVEIDNFEMFGFETIFNFINDATEEFAVDIVEGISEGEDVSVDLSASLPNQSFDKFDFSIGKTVLTDVTAHPWVLNLTELQVDDDEQKNEDFNKLWQMFQKFSAWTYALSYENYASYNVDFQMEMSDEDIPFIMAVSYELMGYRDVHRGNTGFGIVQGSRSLSDISIPVVTEEAGGPEYQPMKTESYTEYYTMENVNMSGILRHIALGKFPDRTESELMSLGVFNSGPSWSKFNDIELFSVESARFDMSEFHWFIPEVIEMSAKDMKFNIGGFVTYMESVIAIPDDDPEASWTDEQKRVAAESVKILEKYDLVEPIMDFEMSLHWNAETGASDMGYSFDIADFFSYDVKTDVILPDYVTAMAAIPEDLDAFDKDAFAAMVAKEVAFKKYRVLATDRSGMEKSFAMAVDFAQLMPDDDPSTAMLRSTTPEILRNMATNAFILPMSEVGKIFPPGVQYLQSISDFVGKGGSLEIEVDPLSPLTVSDFESIQTWMTDDPEKIVEKLGLSVVHTPTQ